MISKQDLKRVCVDHPKRPDPYCVKNGGFRYTLESKKMYLLYRLVFDNDSGSTSVSVDEKMLGGS